MHLKSTMAKCKNNSSNTDKTLNPEPKRKEVQFEGGKVLVSRLGGDIHATSAFCTHYGAPLAKGVLTADGRIVWCAIIPLSPPPSEPRLFATAHGMGVSPTTLGLIHSSQFKMMLLACFNVHSGDIEDAPALADIHVFKAAVDSASGKICVTADPTRTQPQNKSRPSKVTLSLHLFLYLLLLF
jgi:hypothetical protein